MSELEGSIKEVLIHSSVAVLSQNVHKSRLHVQTFSLSDSIVRKKNSNSQNEIRNWLSTIKHAIGLHFLFQKL